MKKGNLTREEAIEQAGLAAVEAVEAESCHLTSRCQTDGDNDIEYAASVNFEDADGDECTLTAYYYVDGDWYEALPDDEYGWEDLVDWTIAWYEIT